ncbi:hypothetical protein FRC00_000853, partial [Tulasnella sp. 408]
ADAFGVVSSADCHDRTLDVEENDGENVEAQSPQQPPLVPSPDTVKVVEPSEINPIRELSSAFAPEPLDSSTLYGHGLASEYLNAALITQARRHRLRAQTRRARLVAQDLADSDFPLQTLNVLGFSGPTETGFVAADASAGGSLSAVAPVPSDTDLSEVPSESVVQSAPFALKTTPQPSELDASLNIETNNCHPTLRESLASSSPSHSLFEYQDFLSGPPKAVEHPPLLNSAEDRLGDVDPERSLYDPVLQCFYLPKVNTVGLRSSPGDDARNDDKERIESARVKDLSLTAVAPAPLTIVSRSENCKLVNTVTPPTPPGTMRPLRDRALNDGMIDPQNSHLVLPNPRPSKSSRILDHPGFASETPAITRSADHHSPPLRIHRDEEVGPQHQTQIRASNYSVSTVVRGSAERENDDFTATVRSETLFKPRHFRTVQTFGSSVTLVDQFPPFATTYMIRNSGSPGYDFRVVDGESTSAGDEAEPSSSDAPILPTPVARRKPRKAKGSSEELVRGHFYQHPRILKSRIVSSLREWGNAASRLLTAQRPAQVGENQTFSPYFDPWEGFVPPRGPSPDLIHPGVGFPTPQPSIKNIYVKFDI